MQALQCYVSESEESEEPPLKRARSSSPVAVRLPAPQLDGLLSGACALRVPAASDTRCVAQTAQEESAADPYEGRLCTLPLQPGDYACHVYLPLPVPPACAARQLSVFLDALSVALPTLRLLPLPLSQGLHVSLSRPFILRRHQWATLAGALRARLASCGGGGGAGGAGGGAPFSVAVTAHVSALLNEHGTRTFLALQLHAACAPRLRAWDAACDEALRTHGVQPHLPPGVPFLPHVSVAWAPGDVTRQLEAAAAQLESQGVRCMGWTAHVSAVKLRVGRLTAPVWGEGTAREAIFT